MLKKEEQVEQDIYRNFLKDFIRKEVDFSATPQNMGYPPPALQKQYPEKTETISLTRPGSWKDIRHLSVEESIKQRRSLRTYSDEDITLDELSFLLWAVQGVRGKTINGHAFRTVPSAGCRHAFETYVALFRVTSVPKGIYRYLPLSHELLHVKKIENLEEEVSTAALGQRFAGEGAATFIWTALPARMEWRYGAASYKVIALDAGHVCQNLYIASASVGSGTCAVAAYDQEKADRLVGADGQEEFVIYMAPLGKVKKKGRQGCL